MFSILMVVNDVMSLKESRKRAAKVSFGCFDAPTFFYVGYKRPAKGASKGARKKTQGHRVLWIVLPILTSD